MNLLRQSFRELPSDRQYQNCTPHRFVGDQKAEISAMQVIRHRQCKAGIPTLPVYVIDHQCGFQALLSKWIKSFPQMSQAVFPRTDAVRNLWPE